MNWFKSFWTALTTPMPREEEPFWEPLNNFTPRAQRVVDLARDEARRLNHSFVGTEHLLLGLARLGQGTACTVLGKLGFDLDTVRLELERQIGKGPETVLPSLIPFTPRVKKTLALAAKEARALNHTSVATEHILLGLIREGDGVAARVLLNLGADTEKTRNQVLEELTGRDTYMPPTTESPKPQCATIDITKRYDVYCNEPHQQVVYRNVMFKGAKTLFRNHEFDLLSGFMELEDGKTIFIARTSLIKFCEHGVTPKAEKMPPSP